MTIKRLRYKLSANFIAIGVALIPDDFPKMVMQSAIGEGIRRMLSVKDMTNDDTDQQGTERVEH